MVEAIAALPADELEVRTKITSFCAAIEHFLGRHEQAHARLVDALPWIPDSASPGTAAIAVELAGDAFLQGDADLLRTWAARGVELAAAAGEPLLEAAATAQLAFAALHEARPAEAQRLRAAACAQMDAVADDWIVRAARGGLLRRDDGAPARARLRRRPPSRADARGCAGDRQDVRARPRRRGARPGEAAARARGRGGRGRLGRGRRRPADRQPPERLAGARRAVAGPARRGRDPRSARGGAGERPAAPASWSRAPSRRPPRSRSAPRSWRRAGPPRPPRRCGPRRGCRSCRGRPAARRTSCSCARRSPAATAKRRSGSRSVQRPGPSASTSR